MMTVFAAFPAFLGAALAAVPAALGAYLLAAKRMSGKIETSSATELWDEAKDMREDYRTQLNESAKRALAMEVRIASIEGQNNELTRMNLELTRKALQCETTIEMLETTIEELRKIIDDQKGEQGE